MNIDKLYVGESIKNYKVLCQLLNQPVKAGSSRKAQLNDFKCYFDWEKDGNKFVITEIYRKPLNKPDRRHLGNRTGKYTVGNSSTYHVPMNLSDSNGVYKIQNGNDIYIGSTVVGFRKRYTQHYTNKGGFMPHTQKLLINGGIFEILWIAPDNVSEKIIREKEQIFINQYKNNSKFNLINIDDTVKIKGNHKREISHRKRVFIDEENFEKALRLLENNNITIYK